MGIIRLLLALAVVFAHSNRQASIGFIESDLAVESFFMVSGFYMSLILNEKYIGKGSYKLFITNRMLRLYPLYWMVGIGYTLCLLLRPHTAEYNYLAQYSHPTSVSTFIFLIFTNIAIFFQDAVMFLGINSSGGLFITRNFWYTDPQLWKFLAVPQAWSIGLELTFYLIAPFLVRRSVPVVLIIIIASFSLRFLAYHKGFVNDPWTYRFFPFELAYFLMGTIAYRAYKRIAMFNTKRLAFFLLGIIVIVSLTYSKWPIHAFNKYLYMLFLAVAIPFVFQLSKRWKWDMQIGDLSYPVYIVHIAVIAVVSANPYIAMGISIVCAFVLNKLISEPIEKYRQARVKAKQAEHKQ